MLLTTYLTYILGIFSLLSLWTKLKTVGYYTVALSILFALASGIITLIGLLVILISICLLCLTSRFDDKKLISIVFFSICAIFLFLNYRHLIPGFNNLCIIKGVTISQDAIPFTLYLNYSSIIPTYFLILFSSEIKLLVNKNMLLKAIKLGIYFGLLATMVLLPISYIFNFIRFDFKLSSITLIFMVVNLIFTCICEEVFWRGFIQTRLQTYINPVLALLATSTAFAFIHIAFAGIYFAILAFIASVIYGLTYIKTNRIEASIICHYMVNIGQFIFFTYPILASAYPH